MPKTTISAKVTRDLEDRVEEAREEGESKSAAISRLLREGLRAKEGDGDGTGDPEDTRGPVVRPTARRFAGLYAGGAFLAFTVLLTGLVVGPLPTAAVSLLTALGIAGGVLAVLLTVFTLTTHPDRLDELLEDRLGSG